MPSRNRTPARRIGYPRHRAVELQLLQQQLPSPVQPRCNPTLISDAEIGCRFVAVIALACWISDDIQPIAALPQLLQQAVTVGW